MLLLFGFIVFLVLSCVVYVVYVVYVVCKALFKALFFARKTSDNSPAKSRTENKKGRPI